jgi:hypothetical protein
MASISIDATPLICEAGKGLKHGHLAPCLRPATVKLGIFQEADGLGYVLWTCASCTGLFTRNSGLNVRVLSILPTNGPLMPWVKPVAKPAV